MNENDNVCFAGALVSGKKRRRKNGKSRNKESWHNSPILQPEQRHPLGLFLAAQNPLAFLRKKGQGLSTKLGDGSPYCTLPSKPAS